MVIKYKDGREFDLVFDEEAHTYKVDGEKIHSVTKILDACFPKYLTDWAVTEGADFFKASLEPYRLAPTEEVGTFMLPTKVVDHIYKGIQTAHKLVSGEAAQVGTSVHNWLSDAIKWKMGKGEEPAMPINEEARQCVRAFKRWASTKDIEWICTEEKIYHYSKTDRHKYCGTIDALAKIDKVECLIDFKTSKKIYKPNHLQIAAYAHAMAKQHRKRRPATGVILRLDKNTGDFQEKRFDVEPHIDMFFKCLDLKDWNSKRISNESQG